MLYLAQNWCQCWGNPFGIHIFKIENTIPTFTFRSNKMKIGFFARLQVYVT